MPPFSRSFRVDIAAVASLARHVVAGRLLESRAVALDRLTPPDWIGAGLECDDAGTLVGVFELDPDLAREVLLPATKADALPDGYAPGDLVSAAGWRIPASGAQRLRAVVVDDTRALIQDAAASRHELYVGSGFRSQEYQVEVFAAQVACWGDEETANRYSARPGHSQHQLGTTVDFTDAFRGFRDSPAADWLRDNAHRFGFVLPYAVAATARTGYVDEPWHGRWVGPALAGRLQAAGRQRWSDVDADNVLAWVRDAAGAPALGSAASGLRSRPSGGTA